MTLIPDKLRAVQCCLWSCATWLVAGSPSTIAHTVAAADQHSVAQAANAAGLRLFAQVFPAGGNACLAPLSVTSALAIVQAGAEQETRQQLRRFLAGEHDPDVIDGYASLVRSLDLPPKPGDETADRLGLAHGLWHQSGFPVQDAYRQHVRDQWGVAVEPLDFHDQLATSRGVIAAWCAQQDPLLDDTTVAGATEETRLFLAATASLRAAWFARFQPGAPGAFHISPDRMVTCDYMQLTLPVPYWQADGVCAVRVPFRETRWSIVLLVPESAEALSRVEAALAAGQWPFRLDEFERRPVALRVAKFRHRFVGIDLRPGLTACGVEDLFTRSANLNGIGQNLFLESLHYGSEFALDENGCEAAAAASLNVIIKAEPTPFATDRPFLYFVLDEPTGLVLFVGRVQDPADVPGRPPAP